MLWNTSMAFCQSQNRELEFLSVLLQELKKEELGILCPAYLLKAVFVISAGTISAEKYNGYYAKKIFFAIHLSHIPIQRFLVLLANIKN